MQRRNYQFSTLFPDRPGADALVVPPSPPVVIEIEPGRKLVAVGNVGWQLVCRVKGKPPPTITWKRGIRKNCLQI